MSRLGLFLRIKKSYMNQSSTKSCSFLLVVIVLIAIPIRAFTQTEIQGVVIDYQSQGPVIGATVVTADNAFGTLTDSSGLFKLSVDQFPIEIEVSHLSYQKRRLVIPKDEFVEVIMFARTYDMQEAVVEGSLFQRISKEKHLFVTDFRISKGIVYYLGFEKSSKTGILSIENFDDKKAQEIVITNPLELDQDFLSNIHVFTKDSIYQILISDSISLFYPVPNDVVNHELFSFIDFFGPYLIKKQIADNNQVISFIAIDTSSFSSEIIYESFNPELFNNNIAASKFRMWRYRGEGKMAESNCDVANYMFERYSYDKNVKYQKLDACLCTKDQNIIILDPNNWKLVFLNKDFKIIESIPLTIEKSSQNHIELIKDDFTKNVYIVNSNWGKVSVYSVNPELMNYTRILSLDGYTNIQKPQIYKDKLYFLYLTKSYPSVNALFARPLGVNSGY